MATKVEWFEKGWKECLVKVKSLISPKDYKRLEEELKELMR